MSEDGGANDRTRTGPAAPRRLAAIVMGDIANYSRLMGDNERGTHQRVQTLHHELIEPTIIEHRGRIIRTRGDDFLAMFDSPVEAVRCAIVLQQAMVSRNLELPQSQWIRFRIGVNLGDVIVESDDIYGDGVNVAARLEQLAEPGTIYISGGVYELVRYRLVCGYQSMGDARLKNITDPVPIYRVLPDPASVAKATRSHVTRYGAFTGAALIIAAGVWFGLSRISDHAPPTVVASLPQPPPQPTPTPPAQTPTPPPIVPAPPPAPAAIVPAVQITPPPAPAVVADPPPDTVERPHVTAPPTPPPRQQEAMVVPPPIPPAPAVTEPEMVAIDGGSFHMGSNEDPSEQPIHLVTVKSFLIGKYITTLKEWRKCVQAKACTYVPEGSDDTPLSNVSWNDAQQYVEWLSSVAHHQYRLPSEAEWEFAARGGTNTRYWWGNAMKPGLANCKGCDPPNGAVRPVKIGTRPPNQYGLYDIDSGITEWVEDCWSPDYRGAPVDGAARQVPNCRERVLRGGAWSNDASYMRSASRDSYDAVVRYPTHGFRVARSP